MNFLISTLVKVITVAGVAGVAVGVPLSLSKSRNGKEIQFEISKEEFDQIQRGQGDSSANLRKYLPEGCKVIASNDHFSSKVKELLVCPFGSSPSLYLYEMNTPEEVNSKTLVTAKKVKNLSRSEEKGSINLLITLEDSTKQDLSPKFSSKWADVENLVPERDCEITSRDNKQSFACKNQTINIEFE
ncbi:hypothetical protein WEN_00570 [Mycoplasma wenyonii str. Massachusetts]|uniref:Uncharacterized protein n=1 Tax=Mycoplasma wenyonii (strain Massachusetts) TaxID=1197325 RepID=I6YAE9_MYCWM|nr:hypothetical protein [Mycoplasma wenyonii]AFN64921.1 hypothetical protein WEN_00570 [Mycoplasma wenyonii str. Massachusetts]